MEELKIKEQEFKAQEDKRQVPPKSWLLKSTRISKTKEPGLGGGVLVLYLLAWRALCFLGNTVFEVDGLAIQT